MKDIIQSVKDNLTSRMKNPLIGAFVLSWTIIHIKGVIVFIISDSTKRLAIINGKEFQLISDIALPLLISLLYLFLMPFISKWYESFYTENITKPRLQEKYKTSTELAITRRDAVSAEVESDVEYIKKTKDKDIENWLIEKTELTSINEELNETLNNAKDDLKNTIKRLDQTLLKKEELKRQISSLTSKREIDKNTVNIATKSIDSLVKNLENNADNNILNANTKHALITLLADTTKSIRDSIIMLRAEFEIDDNDQPF